MAAIAAAGAAAALAVDIAETVLVQIVGQLVAGVIAAALAPELEALQEKSWSITPIRSLSAADAANAQLRGYLSNALAANEAAASGYNGERFRLLVESLGQPLPALTLLEAFRRGLIDWDNADPNVLSVGQGVRESDTKNKYLGLLQKLQYLLPDPGTITEARLRGYITPAEFDRRMNQSGYDADARRLIYVAAGVPISPQEGYAAYHRKLIPRDDANPDVPSLAQIFRESRINDKYLDVWEQLQQYVPPPRTVTALLRAGSITEAQARTWFSWSGLSDEAVTAYIADASKQKVATTKELAVASVTGMYAAKELTREQAVGYITDHGYTAEDAAFLLDYEDFKLVRAQVDALVSRVRTYYVGHKISKQAAVDALGSVGLEPTVVSQLLATWDQEAAASPVLLTATEIATAAARGWLDPTAALGELEGRGYDLRDAFVTLLAHKVDVTGMDPEVLRGALDSLALKSGQLAALKQQLGVS